MTGRPRLGRVRWFAAAALLAVYFVLPAPDRHELAFLDLRAWLLADEGPLDAAARGDRSPLLAAEWLGGEPAARAAREADCARLAREHARERGRAADPSAAPLGLRVRVGQNGHDATLFLADGSVLATRQVLREPRAGLASDAFWSDRRALLPAILAIALALALRRVVPALVCGCLCAAVLVRDSDPLAGAAHLAVDVVGTQVLGELFNLEVMAFVVFLFATIGVLARSGAIAGMVARVERHARGPLSTQLCAWCAGLLVFFDDYSNCVIVGTTLRPLTDRQRVSREKLAYIVDSTAAPLAAISVFSTWIAYEVSLFASQLPEVSRPDGSAYTSGDGFGVFLATLPFRFYCGFTLVLVLLTIVLRRELGPMLGAERRARHDGLPLARDARPMSGDLAGLAAEAGRPGRARDAALPILTMILVTLGLVTQWGLAALTPAERALPLVELVPRVLGAGESQRALLVGSAAGFVLALLLVVRGATLPLRAALLAAARAVRSLAPAFVILILAWAIGELCEGELGTARYLVAAFRDAFAPQWLPLALFACACFVSFATGTSYGTMAILLPNVVVLAHTMGAAEPALGGTALMLLSIGAVLEGSIFGDHCSPISDTTVLSSMASGCDLLHHVRTQLPYALLAMAVSALCGYLPVAFLAPSFAPLCWLLGILVMAGVLLAFGRDPARRAA
ncbi:MAG: Na+/H+ antiporter NhaC family protein [Planctomycetes bacterium]|nr:Na+/H+ antiporter NhaC family protein [Planctomycetota bacterium]